MAPLRGVYDDKAGAHAAIAARGGWLAMCAGLAASAGMRAVGGCARPGDLGLTADRGGARGLALCVGGAWAIKSPRGLTLVSQVVAAWRL
jgi:hypothetical protein